MKASSIVGAAAMLVAGTSFSYDTLVWTGKYNNYFDTTTENWTNQLTGAEAVFEGAETAAKKTNPLVFRVAEGETISVAINQKNAEGYCMNPETILFDVDGTMTFTNNDADYFLSWANGPWTKRGGGKVDCNTAKTRMFIRPTQLTVEDGEFWCTGNYMMQYWFPNNSPITVKSGATLHLRGTNLEGSNKKAEKSLSKITVEAGGRFCIDTYNNDGTTLQNGHNVLPPMEFNSYDGFDCSYCKGYDYKHGEVDFPSLCRFSLSGKVTLNGSGTPYEWLESSVVDSSYSGVNLWSDKQTEFEVADVTGDASMDFNLNFILCNFCTNTSSTGCSPAGFTKSGPGTMRLSNLDNQFTGDVDVKGGTLQVGQEDRIDLGYHKKTHLGWMDRNPDRKITTYSGATFEILGGITFGNADSPYYAPYSSITNDHILGEFIFDGGALKIADGMWNAFPSLTFKNGGTVNTGCNSGGNEGAGRIRIINSLSILKGTVNTPFVWPFDGETYKTRLELEQYAGQGITLNGYPENTFCVEDLTGDDGVDATFEVPFFISEAFFRNWASGNHTLDDWSFGYTKTGEGTLRYTAPDVFASGSSEVKPGYCTYNGDTKVNEGTLQMDGDIHRSDTVRVAAGAYLAGTGTVNNVSLASGAGWKASAGQTHPLTVKGSLTVGENMTISLSVPNGVSYEDIRAKLLTVEGATTGLENLLNATVKVNGETVTNVRPTLKDGVLVVRYVRGMMFIVM